MPVVVPGLPELLLLLPPQLMRPTARNASSVNILSIDRQRRWRAGIPKKMRQANVAPPAAYHGTARGLGLTNAPVVAVVVVTMSVPVPFDAPVMLTGDVAPKLKVGGSVAPVGLDVRAAVSVTLPVNPPLGITVMVVVFPVVAPGELMVITPPLLSVKLGAMYALTLAVTVVGMVIAPEVPVTVTAYAPAVVVVVVITVSVAFCAETPVMVTEGVTLQVAGLVGFVSVVVTAQVRLTAPVKPFDGVTVIVAVLPVAALASKVMGPLFESERLGDGAAVTVTVFIPVALL